MTSVAPIAREIREALVEAVGEDELKTLQHKSLWRSIAWLTAIWAGIAAAWTLTHFTLTRVPLWGLVVVPTTAVYVGTRIHALSVQIHEGSHYLLASTRRVSDMLANFGAGYWILNSVAEYRAVHNLHHRHLHEEADPDGALYLGEKTPRQLCRDLLSDLIGLTALKRGRIYIDSGIDAGGLKTWAPKIAANLSLWGLWVWQAGFWMGSFEFCLLWAVPLLSVFPAITRLRLLGEHYTTRRTPGRGRFVARTTQCSSLTRHLIGARMEYHFEHHLLPGIPYRNLPKLHRRLTETGFFERIEGRDCEVISPGYVEFWRTRLFEPSERQRPAIEGVEAGDDVNV